VLSGSKGWAAGGRRLGSLKPLRSADDAESVSENSGSGVRSNDFSRFWAHESPPSTTKVITTNIFQTPSERDDALSEFSGVQCAQRFEGFGGDTDDRTVRP
jgi:hypothetical protein